MTVATPYNGHVFAASKLSKPPPTEPPPSALIQAALDFLKAFSTLSPGIVTSHCTPDFTHSVSPSSLALPSRNLEEFTTHSGRVFSLFTTWDIVPQSIFEDVAKSTVVLHVKMGGKVKGRALGDLEVWGNEAVFWIELGQFEGGWAVKAVREFVDSKLAEELRRLLAGTAKERTLEE
ncbi:uncharacterized protein BDZ99DRAFT_538611 [Mytilinidion resinicola]|uniref:Uncharacterized protein n=1 Tax=Mytilinidion resinicola TaxID=574789 RepID=A0A6A6YEV3_9PEZI|nr:uncharacterized protein BDZ99DRAFT_538611 [Mytilinidion resinicola]KAF2806387.1 hypothetical protein BDZ99DRAFT_538611 [Mytilinidion resinicola]